MSPPIWLIEANVYGDEALPLLGEIRRQGMLAEIIPHQALKKGATLTVAGHTLSSDDCVLGYGTFPFARQIQLHHPWRPGAWCSIENLDCAAYFAHFGRFLLNQEYAILPGVEAIRNREWLFSVFGRDDQVFARPTGCQKLFTGRCIDRESFASALAPTRYDPATLVVIAKPQSIDREWRGIVVEGTIVAGSQYAVSGERAIAADFPPEVRAFAETMAKEARWRPDPVFMMDIAESAGRLWLVELNSFSSSWLYAADLATVVRAVSECAMRAVV